MTCGKAGGLAIVRLDAWQRWRARNRFVLTGDQDGGRRNRFISDMVAAWEDYTEEVPSETDFLGFIWQEFVNPSYAGIEVVDLTKYC